MTAHEERVTTCSNCYENRLSRKYGHTFLCVKRCWRKRRSIGKVRAAANRRDLGAVML